MAIGRNTWLTPTTYGAVITQHIPYSENSILNRIYLDKTAVKALLSDSDDVIYGLLREKGLNPADIKPLMDRFSDDNDRSTALQEERGWRLFSYHPLQISCQIVNYCNARCDFCYAGAPEKRNAARMALADIKKLKDYAAGHGVKIGISGGEPTLHPDILDILAYRNDEVFDTLITNLSTDIDTGKLVKTGVDLVQVSIHGRGPCHDRTLKIDGIYDMVIEKMTDLASGIGLATNTVVTPQNLNSIPGFVSDMSAFQDDTDKALGYLRLVPVMESGTGIGRYPADTAFLEAFTAMAKNVIARFPDINFEVPLLHPNPYEYFTVDGLKSCPAGSTVCVVRVDGRISPCNQFIETEVVSDRSLHEEEFHDIWLNDRVLSGIRQGIKVGKNDAGCDECAYLLLK